MDDPGRYRTNRKQQPVLQFVNRCRSGRRNAIQINPSIKSQTRGAQHHVDYQRYLRQPTTQSAFGRCGGLTERSRLTEMKRIAFLDGFRGVAIILVVLYHAYVRYPESVPYGDRFTGVILFKEGLLGVQLFFLLSGFVILMTLRKTRSYLEFLKKRWLRLFPAMLIVTVILFPISQFLDRKSVV